MTSGGGAAAGGSNTPTVKKPSGAERRGMEQNPHVGGFFSRCREQPGGIGSVEEGNP